VLELARRCERERREERRGQEKRRENRRALLQPLFLFTRLPVWFFDAAAGTTHSVPQGATSN
jgi:hypothetical protein